MVSLERSETGSGRTARSSLMLAQTVGGTVLAGLLLVLVYHGTWRDASTSRGLKEGRKLQEERFPDLMFVKAHKVGGSTMGGLIRRVVSRHGGTPAEYTHKLTTPMFFAKPWNVEKRVEEPDNLMHMWSNHRECHVLRQDSVVEVFNKAFKITLVREPVDRCLSQFYYDGNSGVKQALMQTDMTDGVYRPSPDGTDPVSIANIAYVDRCMVNAVYKYVKCEGSMTMQEVLDTYDVVGLTERWMDTVAVIKMKLGLNYGDILHLSSKLNNGEEGASGGKVTAMGRVRPPMGEEPASVLSAISSHPDAVDDTKFWHMASDKLDAQIEVLKPQGFDAVRRRVEELLSELKEACATKGYGGKYSDEEKIEYLKSRVGEKYNTLWYIDCYWYDNGCGRKCMDKFSEERGLDKEY